MRLQKFLSKAGIASRRKAEEIIKRGEISVNDSVITEMGFKVDISKDIIKYKNNIISIEENKVYLILNKPENIITSSDDQFNRKTVIDFIDIKERVFPVGRLDYNTSGLILLTNDGDLANKLIHPRYGIVKSYEVIINGNISKSNINKFQNGLIIDKYKTKPCKLKLISNSPRSSKLMVYISEGKNRQIRKMFDAIGHKVLKLERKSIGPIHLNDLPKGKYRSLSKSELNLLKGEVND